VITVAEIFVLPEKAKNQFIISEYEKVFQHLPNVEIIPVDWQIARLASKLRANYHHIRTPDALQLATPLLKDYPAFLTNDEKLKKVSLLKVMVLKDYL
ncbi:PIN domain-containing protein, partial [Candidatus Roizmanbacteria bacterium]|nr:PIN domain-containing protein [Candidatus Roizmanbacteria bacterium]